MTDVYEHNPADHEDPLPGPTWMIGFIGVVLLIVIVLGITALFHDAWQADEEVKVVDAEPVEMIALRRQQAAQLEAMRWEEREEIGLDGQPTTVRALVIPIDRAMELIVQEYRE
jgi:hypothetical protein